jgi:N-acetylneuraminate synthase
MTAPYLIAEIAQAHDGSLGILHSYIDAVAQTGVQAIKFQTHIAAAESSEYEPFRVKFSRADATRYDYWKRMELTEAQWQDVAAHCRAVGLDFISSPFSVAAVHLLEAAGVQRYKVGSGEITNLLLLDTLAQTGKPIIISSGMSSWHELDTAVDFLRQRGATPAVLQCTTAYPTQPSEWALTQIAVMKQRYQTTVGYSDHSGTPVACLAAAALGAEILEFHAVFDKRMFGPDAKASLTIDEIAWLAAGVKMIAAGMQPNTLKDDASRFDELKTMFGKSLAVNKDLPAGHQLQLSDLESKKPAGKGLPAAQYASVIGRRLRHSLRQWSFLNETDLEHN